VVATDATILMVKTRRGDIDTQEVQTKAVAGARWRGQASAYATEIGSKPWRYLLVLHDEVTESKQLSDYMRFEK
jgi:type III restriction enzyme